MNKTSSKIHPKISSLPARGDGGNNRFGSDRCTLEIAAFNEFATPVGNRLVQLEEGDSCG